jgi:hypothetical protein
MERLHGGRKYREDEEVKDREMVKTIFSELCLKRNISVIDGKDIPRAKHLTEYGQNTYKERKLKMCINKVKFSNV